MTHERTHRFFSVPLRIDVYGSTFVGPDGAGDRVTLYGYRITLDNRPVAGGTAGRYYRSASLAAGAAVEAATTWARALREEARKPAVCRHEWTRRRDVTVCARCGATSARPPGMLPAGGAP